MVFLQEKRGEKEFDLRSTSRKFPRGKLLNEIRNSQRKVAFANAKAMVISMKLIREKSCCFTGHRIIAGDELPALRERLREEIIRLAEQGIDTFLAGGALGFDTLAAQEVLSLRETELPEIHLVLVLPCLGQESRWDSESIELYHDLIRQADEVIYTGDIYTEGCMHTRNRYLVNHSSRCLCYLKDTAQGGTAYTVRYAKRQGLQITNLAGESETYQLSF